MPPYEAAILRDFCGKFQLWGTVDSCENLVNRRKMVLNLCLKLSDFALRPAILSQRSGLFPDKLYADRVVSSGG